MTETIDNFTCCQCTDGCTETVGHHHKQALCRCLDLGVTLLVDKDTTRDIKKVKSYTLDDT